MNNLLVAVFDTELAAYEGLNALQELHQEADLALYASAVMMTGVARTCCASVKQTTGEGPAGDALAVLTESLLSVGLARAGVAAWAPDGGLAWLAFDTAMVGVGLDFLGEVSQALAPGKAVVLAEVEETWATPADMRLRKLGGIVFRRHRAQVAEDWLAREAAAWEAELRQLKAELTQANAENWAALHGEIEGVRQKLEAAQAQIEARQAQGQRETEAKIEALREQMKGINGRPKAKIQQYLAEVAADQDRRSATLGRAKRIIQEALSA